MVIRFSARRKPIAGVRSGRGRGSAGQLRAIAVGRGRGDARRDLDGPLGIEATDLVGLLGELLIVFEVLQLTAAALPVERAASRGRRGLEGRRRHRGRRTRSRRFAPSLSLEYDRQLMETARAAFERYLTAEKRASAHTIRAYLHDLAELEAHARAVLGRAPTLDELDAGMCRSYLASLHGRNDAVTIGRKLSSLRAFFRLAVRRRLTGSSPVAALRAPKRASGCRRSWARTTSAASSTDAIRAPTRTRPRLRSTRALFEVIYGAGLRVSEACHLDLGDIETDGRGRASACARARDARIASCRSAPRPGGRSTTTCLTGRRLIGGGGAHAGRAALFVTRRGRRLGPRAVRRLLARREQMTGVRRRSRRTRSATASRPTCWARARICARSRRCSDTRACAPPSATLTSTSII